MDESMRKKFLLGRRLWGIFCFAFTLMLSIHFYGVSQTFQVSTSSFFNEEQLWNSPQSIEFTSRIANQNVERVVLLVLDGLRFDAVKTHPNLTQLMDNISKDSYLLKLNCQLPSISYPNWATILSSAPPEWTGVTSNQNSNSFFFDTVVERARVAEVPVGFIALDEWGFIVKRSLSPFVGDAMVTWSSVPEDPAEFTIRHAPFNAHDELTARRIYQAISENNFKFVFGYFADIDARSHQWGAISPQCTSAIANKTRILENIINLIDDKTILMITSDHGHVDQGGHGGTSPSVMEIPLILYQKNSGWSQKPTVNPGLSFSNFQEYSQNLDIAPSVSALLGISTPAQAKGVFLDPILQILDSDHLEQTFQQLYEQKKNLASLFFQTLSTPVPPEIFNLKDPSNDTSLSSLQKCQVYRDNVIQIMSTLSKSRESDFFKRMALNITIVAIVGFIFITTSTVLLQQFSICNFLFIALGSKEALLKRVGSLTGKKI